MLEDAWDEVALSFDSDNIIIYSSYTGTLFLYYKNHFYKDDEAEICPKI